MSDLKWLASPLGLVLFAAAVSITPGEGQAFGQVPSISDVSPRGIQIGGVTEIEFRGENLSRRASVVLPFDGYEQKVLPGGNRKRLVVKVTLPETIVPGIYPVRISTDRGITRPLACGVDFFPQFNFDAPIEKLPIALTGKLEGNNVLLRHFSGKKGDQVVVAVEARRIGATFQPLLRILDGRGKELIATDGLVSIAQDARCELTLPADGKYTIELHDQEYLAKGPGWFRLKIGTFSYADYLFPLAARRGQAGLFQLAGSNLPPKLRLKVTGGTDGRYRPEWSEALNRFSGAMPQALLCDYDQIVEKTPDEEGVQRLDSWPVGVHGRLSEAQEEDRYRLACQPGAALRMEVFGQRANSPVDAVLILRTTDGEQLAVADDQEETRDPLLEFKVPDGVDSVEVAVRDMLGRGGDDFLYRLDIQEASRPNFELTLSGDGIQVPVGGRSTFRVDAKRRHYDGPIQIDATDLPDGLSFQVATIPAGRDAALIQLEANRDIQQQSQTIHLLGRSAEDGEKLIRSVQFPLSSAVPWQPNMREEIGLAITKATPFLIDWRIPQPVCTADDSINAVMRVSRAAKFDGRIRVVLLAVEVPRQKSTSSDATKEVDNERGIFRFSESVEFAADSNEESAKIVIPAGVPAGRYQLAILGQWLSDDGTTVMDTTSSTLQEIEVRP